MLYTTATAPKGYVGPVCLTAEQRARSDESMAKWLGVLHAQAANDADPEIQACAVRLLQRFAKGC